MVAACGGDDDGGGASDTTVALVEGSETVEARDNLFEPDDLSVPAGTTIVFENTGRNEHNVVPAEGTADTISVDVEDLEPGATAERRLTEPGEYRYYCSIHGTETAGMVGTITVTG